MKRWIFITFCVVVGFWVAFSALAQKDNQPGEQNMALEQNKQLVQRLSKEVFNQRKTAVIDDIYAPDMVDHSAFPDQAPGAAGVKTAINGFFEIFSDFEVTVEDMVAQEDRLVTRETWRGTHRPSNKSALGTVIHIFRVRDGRITDEWSRGWDWLDEL
jgi:predicted SnoaL-like aldol condensation-catalyzing enzyme